MLAQIDKFYIKTRPYKIYSRLISYLFYEGRPLTTKGRWINSIVFKILKIQKKLPQLRKVNKPVFIVGTGRSGTTILGVILSIHKQVAFLNEPKAIWNFVYSKEDLIGSYTQKEAKYYLGRNNVTKDIQRNIHRIYGAYLFLTRSERIVDKYPELIFRIPFVLKIFPDAKFIFLVRNGWDTINSIQKWSDRLGQQKNGDVHDWWGVNNRKWKLLKEQVIKEDPYFKPTWNHLESMNSHFDFSALEWIATMRIGLNLIDEFPENLIRVDYESLAKYPEENLNKIRSFCELREDPVYIKYGKNVLKPSSARPKVNLHPSIELLFDETMQKLGYS